ncbi:nitroreductase family protein, partial [Chloroflexota bacterium]
PWRFIVIKGKEQIETLVSRAFSEGNQVAKEAPIIIVACAKPNDDIVRDGKEYYLHDVGMAVENMLLAATELGLATHPMTGVNEDELKRILCVPPEVRFVIATPLAYPVTDSYDEASKERLGERTRKTLDELVYYDEWGKSF